jgi:hypothetical protein
VRKRNKSAREETRVMSKQMRKPVASHIRELEEIIAHEKMLADGIGCENAFAFALDGISAHRRVLVARACEAGAIGINLAGIVLTFLSPSRDGWTRIAPKEEMDVICDLAKKAIEILEGK